MTKRLPIIGRKELVELPDLDIGKLEAKIDTGAYRSSMHCRKAEIVRSKGHESLIVQFQIGHKRPKRVFDKFKKTKVRSSNGAVEERFVIQTKIRIGKKTVKASFTLTDRSEMKHQMLIGRKFLSERYLVDVSQEHLTR